MIRNFTTTFFFVASLITTTFTSLCKGAEKL